MDALPVDPQCSLNNPGWPAFAVYQPFCLSTDSIEKLITNKTFTARNITPAINTHTQLGVQLNLLGFDTFTMIESK